MKAVLALLLLCVLAGCTTTSSKPRRSAEEMEQDARNRARAHLELGMVYYESRNYQFAIDELNEALKAKSDYVPAIGGLALIHMELGEDKKAEDGFRRALRIDPNSSDIHNNYGQFLCARGRTEEGLRQLLDAVKNPLYETPDMAYRNAGLCARRAGDDRAAEEYFRQAVMRNPRQGQALYNLADLNYVNKNFSQAKIYSDRLMQLLDRPGPDVLWLAARIERKLGNTEALGRYAEQMRSRFPESDETRALLSGRNE